MASDYSNANLGKISCTETSVNLLKKQTKRNGRINHSQQSGPESGDLPPLRLEWAEADSLENNPRNWRRHPAKQMAALRDVIEDVGWAGALLYNERTGRLLDGHARKKLGGVVPVLIGSWTEEQERKILATLDPLAAMAEADGPMLEALLREVHSDSAGVQAMLENLAKEHGLLGDVSAGLTDPDAIPELPDEAVTRPGDLWRLGEHRLFCGDSGKPEDVDRLLGGAGVDLVVSDPPCRVRSKIAVAAGPLSFPCSASGIGAGPVGKSARKKIRGKDRPIANNSGDEFARLLRTWFENVARVLRPGRCFYLWGGYANYPLALKAAGLHFSQAIIWVKEHPVLSRKDFMDNHEMCFYGWREGAAHRFFGPANATDVWSVKEVSAQHMLHLTEKPVELAVRAMQFSSQPGENVLDLFGGSGSTMIAAQQTGRRAFLMEIDPLHCDRIVRRFERFTGIKAQRDQNG